jgi:hypothetical protein
LEIAQYVVICSHNTIQPETDGLILTVSFISDMPALQYGRETGRDKLECRRCGAQFPEGQATDDGWHYVCPECEEGRGIGDGLRVC